ncbi:tautomerase family protein [Rhodocyclus tenuis]|uniref:tautomerase family protein n=1 Tax=Rhodocyclus tenuis TaxID=1066 RepID=UPI001905C6AC|nr:4-oxalocrotonate tautomerase family protein [Rhodocyclus tenuis]MBK1681002.1 4-oxalocrotonate tautomerase [Rhodocyclus tenuis]
MPILNVKIAAPESPELTAAVASSLIELTARVLRKKPEVTSVAISYLKPENWIIGGASLPTQGRSSFYFDIRITDETNTKAEKEQYIREAYALFARLLGNVHEVSYIHVEDVRAAAYGYGGLTQEYRYHH